MGQGQEIRNSENSDAFGCVCKKIRKRREVSKYTPLRTFSPYIVYLWTRMFKNRVNARHKEK